MSATPNRIRPLSAAVISRLTAWYDQHQRPLPWRATADPYRIWISEVMLQQTRVDTVIPYYGNFIARFPDVASLARADMQLVLKAWEGLGYYRRAHGLHKAARLIAGRTGGALPTEYHDLRQLPGLGDYSAAAIASIAFGKCVPAVDGNVLRVCARYWGIRDDIRRQSVRRAIFDRLAASPICNDPGRFNQALMEVGALVCLPTRPACTDCPLHASCYARRHKEVGVLPVLGQKAPVPTVRVGAGVLVTDQRLLLSQRQGSGMLQGLWMFPGIEITADDDATERVGSFLAELIGDAVPPLVLVGTVRHAYTHYRLILTVYMARLPAVAARCAPDGAESNLRWVSRTELAALPLDRATHKVLARLPPSTF